MEEAPVPRIQEQSPVVFSLRTLSAMCETLQRSQDMWRVYQDPNASPCVEKTSPSPETERAVVLRTLCEWLHRTQKQLFMKYHSTLIESIGKCYYTSFACLHITWARFTTSALPEHEDWWGTNVLTYLAAVMFFSRKVLRQFVRELRLSCGL